MAEGAAARSVGAPAGGAVGLAPAPLAPLRPDSALRATRFGILGALAAGRLAPPPLTQAERDSIGRALTGAAVAMRGTPFLHASAVARAAGVGGGGVSVPLPFGGPSRRRRERDRAVNAATLEIVARVQRRADSAVAARRWRADSLAAGGVTPR